MSGPLRSEYDVVIVGAGFAGAATAAALTARGVGDVLILEAEAVPGAHGSGRNAGMARRVIEDPVLAAAATESVARFRALAQARGVDVVYAPGGMLVGSRNDVERLARDARTVPALAAELELLSPAQATARVPALEGAGFEAAVFTPGCATIDIHALLTMYLDLAREGGAQLAPSTPLEAVEVDGGAIRAVRAGGRRVATRALVNAAGFRANEVAALAGVPELAFTPARRHLFVAALEGVDRAWPFVWDITQGYYFRPEGSGVLLCACDETPWPPEDPPVDRGAREDLAEKLAAQAPALAAARPMRQWAGLRVLTPDGRFAIGPDPALRGFTWVAGLGGHGMTTSGAVGWLGASAVLDGTLPAPYDRAFAPARLR